jgi:CheY-like chemotaxis protein
MSQVSRRPFDILIVEDNPADVRLFQEAFRETPSPKRLHVASNGSDALDFVRKRGKYETAPTPDLILLDLNIPRESGMEILAEIKRDPNLKCLVVMVITVSPDPGAIGQAYSCGANCCLIKPVEIDEFMESVAAIEEFWFRIAKLPSSCSSNVRGSGRG